jgi:hypothetical protein
MSKRATKNPLNRRGRKRSSGFRILLGGVLGHVANVDQIGPEGQLGAVLFNDSERQHAGASRLLHRLLKIGGSKLLPFHGKSLRVGRRSPWRPAARVGIVCSWPDLVGLVSRFGNNLILERRSLAAAARCDGVRVCGGTRMCGERA